MRAFFIVVITATHLHSATHYIARANLLLNVENATDPVLKFLILS